MAAVPGARRPKFLVTKKGRLVEPWRDCVQYACGGRRGGSEVVMWGRVFVLLGLAAAAAGSVANADEPRVTARAAIIVDAGTGEVLWERNADWQLPPASTTKVMTAILAIESRRLDD